jgi:hypothetical protein
VRTPSLQRRAIGAGRHLRRFPGAYRRYEEAVAALRAGLRASPSDYFNHAGLAASYAQLGRKDEAVQAAKEVRCIWPFFDVDTFAAQFDEANRALIVEGLHKAGRN